VIHVHVVQNLLSELQFGSLKFKVTKEIQHKYRFKDLLLYAKNAKLIFAPAKKLLIL